MKYATAILYRKKGSEGKPIAINFLLEKHKSKEEGFSASSVNFTASFNSQKEVEDAIERLNSIKLTLPKE